MVDSRRISEKEFRVPEYQANAEHLARISQAAFNRTPVTDVIESYTNRFPTMGDGQRPQIIYSTFGDPAQYPDIGTHRGFKRFERRCSFFLGSNAFNGYIPGGCESLKGRIRDGWVMGPHGGIPVSATDVDVYVTPGVAGALRLICDALIFPPVPSIPDAFLLDMEKSQRAMFEKGEPMGEEHHAHILGLISEYRRLLVKSNVVMPMWTYSSHLAEVYRAHGQVRTCELTPDGQINLESLERNIDENTKAVIFATVGNPLCTAMEPELFDKLLMVVRKKMDEIKRPIMVIADTIYEHFRRRPENRIDPVRRAMALDNGVPVIDTSSFSKMMVLAGARVGFIRHYWPKDSFPDHRHDFRRALELLYWPTLCPVSSQPQIALGELYSAINRKDPVEEDLAPFAAMLTALKYITQQNGRCIKSTFYSFLEVIERMKEWGVEEGYYLDSTVATQTRKVANRELIGYAVDLDHDAMHKLMKKAEAAGIISVAHVNGEQCIRLEKPDAIPNLDFDSEGRLKLRGISSNSSEWREFAKICGIDTEDVLYDRHKNYMTNVTFERTDDFVDRIMSVPGVRLHPAYFDAQGNIVRDRFNAFYALWAFDGLMEPNQYMMQAAKIAELCFKNRVPVIATVPGELFLPPEMRMQQRSFVRQVTLRPPSDNETIRQSAVKISPEAHW